jgi:hypothetical protein
MYTLNIGLNNNPLNPTSIIGYHLNSYDLLSWEVQSGEYNGVKEFTLVAEVNKINAPLIMELCDKLTQECIAVYDHVTQNGILIYNPNFDGTKQKFDPNHFLFIEAQRS